MKKIFTATILIMLCSNAINAQIASGTCGIQYTYDLAGNRNKREYVCVPAPPSIAHKMGIQIVDALYPNPTSGKFTVTFTEPLKDAVVQVCDASGKTLIQMKGNGNKMDFDISTLAAGTYFIKIKDEQYNVYHKVIKQ